jgi:putative acetyltransferase
LPRGLRLRRGTPGDAPAIQRVHEESIRGAPLGRYSRAELESWAYGLKARRYVHAMDRLGETFLVADILARGGDLAGFCSYVDNQVVGLYIHPGWMGQGLAGIMMDHAEAAIVATGARVIAISASEIARPIYEKRGYVVWRRRPWRTRGGLVIDAFDMEKKVTL